MESAIRRANWAALILTLVGCLQMVGYLLDSRVLRGIGAATTASPFPKVFSDVDGLETFASSFRINGLDGQGNAFAMELGPELYSRLQGSYNRRNVYGAALSYAPRMPDELWQSVFCFGLGPEGPLRRELGLPDGASDLVVRISTNTAGRDDVWELRAPCVE